MQAQAAAIRLKSTECQASSLVMSASLVSPVIGPECIPPGMRAEIWRHGGGPKTKRAFRISALGKEAALPAIPAKEAKRTITAS